MYRRQFTGQNNNTTIANRCHLFSFKSHIEYISVYPYFLGFICTIFVIIVRCSKMSLCSQRLQFVLLIHI
jgi:hypothetical protein